MEKKKKIFTEEEVQYILDHWGKESTHSMKNRFNCSWEAVCKVAERHGLELPKSNHWTKEEVEKLEELSWKYSSSEIAEIMNKTELAIYIKARRLGIALIQSRRKWTKEEETYLSDSWGTKSIETIAKNLKRTVFSLKVKAVRMGLGPMIQNNYDFITIQDISDLLSVPRDRVQFRWVKLGLNVKTKRLTDNKSYMVVTWVDLMDFLEKNQDEWDSKCVERNMLGNEPEWLKEKRVRDHEENPAFWYRRYTEEEIAQAENLFKLGKSYKEIAEILNRSELSVKWLLRNRGYSYKMPQYWKSNEFKYLRENYQDMTYAEIGEELGRTEKAVAYQAQKLGYQKRLIKKNSNGDNNE